MSVSNHEQIRRARRTEAFVLFTLRVHGPMQAFQITQRLSSCYKTIIGAERGSFLPTIVKKALYRLKKQAYVIYEHLPAENAFIWQLTSDGHNQAGAVTYSDLYEDVMKLVGAGVETDEQTQAQTGGAASEESKTDERPSR